MDLGSGTGRVKADPPQRAVGQDRLNAAAGEAPVELVEQTGEGRGGKPRDDPAADREAAVRFHQMLAAAAHAGAYWDGRGAWQPIGTIAWRTAARAAGSP